MTSNTVPENVHGQVQGGFWVEGICTNMPYIISAYFVCQFILRISLSSNLEVDEAQFVGYTDLKLMYGNSHPPLYNWLLRFFLEVTNWNWSIALPLFKNLLLWGTFMLGFDLVRRVTQSSQAATIAVVGMLLLPQVVWQSQITLAHSVLVIFGVVATLHAVYMVLEKPNLLGHVWLVAACTIGTLAKFNYFLFLASLICALMFVPALRSKLSLRGIVAATVVYLLLITPTILSVVMNLQQSTERMRKLYKVTDFGKAVDIPYLGIDGFFSFFSAALASIGPLLILLFILRTSKALPELQEGVENTRQQYADLLGRVTAIGLIAFVLIVIAADMHFVHDRYLTPLVMALPLWIALNWRIEGNFEALKGIVRTGFVVMVAVLIGVGSIVVFGKHALAYPYKEFAEGLTRKFGNNIVFLTVRSREFGNLAVRMPGSRKADLKANEQKIIIVWRSDKERDQKTLTRRLGNAYQPVGEVYKQEAMYAFFGENKAGMNALKFIRK